jgi:hypothetical protein
MLKELPGNNTAAERNVACMGKYYKGGKIMEYSVKR